MDYRTLKAIFATILILFTIASTCLPAVASTSDISDDHFTAETYLLEVGSEDLYIDTSSLTTALIESDQSTNTVKPDCVDP